MKEKKCPVSELTKRRKIMKNAMKILKEKKKMDFLELFSLLQKQMPFIIRSDETLNILKKSRRLKILKENESITLFYKKPLFMRFFGASRSTAGR